MEGLERPSLVAGLPPAPARERLPQPIDLERLLHWAFAGERASAIWHESAALTFDRGMTARPRRRPQCDWATAAACAGIRHGAPPRLRLRQQPHPDALLVLAQVRRLDRAVQRLVIHHALKGSRPDWMPGAEPRLVPVWCDPVRRIPRILGRDRNRHYGWCALAWSVDPDRIREARADYARWHAALGHLRFSLDEKLSTFTINGFAAPAQPW